MWRIHLGRRYDGTADRFSGALDGLDGAFGRRLDRAFRRFAHAPHSDLHVFTQQLSVKGFVLIPLLVWQVVWVGIIIAIMGWSLRMAYRADRRPSAASVSGPSARGGGK